MRNAYQQQHALALPDGPTAAQEADDDQEGTDGDQQVSHVEHLINFRWDVVDFSEEVEDGAAVYLHPDPHAQDADPGQLNGREDGVLVENLDCLG